MAKTHSECSSDPMTNRTKSRVFWNYILHAVGIPIAIAIVGIIIGFLVGSSNEHSSDGLTQLLVITGFFILAAVIYAVFYQIWWWVTRVEEHLELTRQIAQAHQPKTAEPSPARDRPQSQPPHSH